MAGVPAGLKGRSFTRIAAWSRAELATLLDLADELDVLGAAPLGLVAGGGTRRALGLLDLGQLAARPLPDVLGLRLVADRVEDARIGQAVDGSEADLLQGRIQRQAA